MSSESQSHSASSFFLIEMIISLFFFSLASVVCVRLFLYAHTVSTVSREQTLAVHLSQNAAESFIAADGNEERFSELFSLTFPGGTAADGAPASGSGIFSREGDTLHLSLDPEFQPAGAAAAAASYLASFRITHEPDSASVPDPGASAASSGTMHRLEIEITDEDSQEVYSLEVLQYEEAGQ